MVKSVKTTLGKFLGFVKDLEAGKVQKDALEQIELILKNVLENQVFTDSYSDVLDISSKDELNTMLRHSLQAPKATYSQDYIFRKEKEGYYYPHVYKNKGFLNRVIIQRISDRMIKMEVPNAPYFQKKGYNYGVIHENTKSVIKATYYLAWDRILNQIIETIINKLK